MNAKDDDQNGNSMILRKATSTRPVIRLVDHEGIQAVVKDFTPNGFFYRNIAGRFLIWREARAYRKLSGLQGVPRLLEVVRGRSLMVEAISGTDLKEAGRQEKLTPDFFLSLKRLVDQVHERGVAHCDLKASGNVLFSSEGRPFIIDWGAAIFRTECRFFPLTMIYDRFVVDDNRAITKFKLRYLPDSIEEDERKQYEHRSWAEKNIRAVRDRLRKFLQAIA